MGWGRKEDVPSLLGKWYGKMNSEPVAVEFRDDGQMAYVVLSGGKTQTMRMTYRIEGGSLITNQASAPREETTQFHFEGKDLLLEFGGAVTRFTR